VDLDFARGQMALSLAFHIVFAAAGIAMPVLMVVAEIAWRRTGDADWLKVARAWAKGTAVLFAVGAVSGTVLSFELGLLFPGFMRHAGAIVGMPFSLEGFAFFLEAIFLGIYLYGWERVAPRWHVAAGVGVAAMGLLSLVFVVLVNAWMNAPVGFRVDGSGALVDIDPVAGMGSPFGFASVVHMAIASYLATAVAAAAVHAAVLLRARASSFHRKALAACLGLAVPMAVLQPLSGDLCGQRVATLQPMKLAAMESQFATERGAPARIGGVVDDEHERVRFAIEIPYGLSLLAFHDPHAEVKGLREFPKHDWPSPIVHYAFQVMVAAGSALAAVAAWVALAWWRRGRKLPDGTWLLRALVVAGPLGMIAIEAGWTVTEVGRQPWVIYGVLRTADAVTPMHGLVAPFLTFALLYVGLAAAVTVILWRQVLHSPDVLPTLHHPRHAS
jgi:cytochrome d ubiquinol oxidase subunit I